MQVLDLAESNVKVSLNRAKQMLRSELSNYYKSSQLFELNLLRCDRILNHVLDKIESY